MEKIKKKVRTLQIMSIIFSLMLVVGIPLIPIFAVKKIWVLMALGIVFLVVGFYGSAIGWAQFGEYKTQMGLVRMIVEEHVYSILELSEQYGNMGVGRLKAGLRMLINNGYLKGYIIKDDMIIPSENAEKGKKKYVGICEFCGGKTMIDGEHGICSYCGGPVHSLASRSKNND